MNEFDKNLKYITMIVSEVRSKISRVIMAKELILKIWRFKYSDFINK